MRDPIVNDLKGLFITGTDTSVGKTWVTAMIARELRKEGVRVGVYKPCCSGAERDRAGRPVWPDVETLAAAIGGDVPTDHICPQRFAAPLAPPVAARLEGRQVDVQRLRAAASVWNGKVDLLLVEGVGGWLCPLTESETVADLAVDFGFPVLVVARLGLGTISHTLLTVEAIERRGLPVAGIVLNEAVPESSPLAAETNPAEIAARCRAPILGILAHGASGGLRQDTGASKIDWHALAASPSRPCSGPDHVV